MLIDVFVFVKVLFLKFVLKLVLCLMIILKFSFLICLMVFGVVVICVLLFNSFFGILISIKIFVLDWGYNFSYFKVVLWF